MYDACLNGNMELVKLLIANNNENDYNAGLRGACQNGNIEMVRLMIAKGANDYDRGLYNTCIGGNVQIVKLLIEKGANDYNLGLHYACQFGHFEIVRLMLEKGASGTLESFFAFPQDKNIIQTLLSSSVSLKVFEKINGYKQLLDVIRQREEYIIHIMNNCVCHTINNFVLKQYILNQI